MNILFVYPKYPDTFWSFKHALKFVGKKAVNPPLGLITVSSMLPIEWNRKLIDMNIEKLKTKHLIWADYVFISAMNVQYSSTMEVIELCRKMNIKTVAGGPLFTEAPNLFSNVNHLILNEAELTLPFFLNDLKNGKPKHIYQSDHFANIKESPQPDYSLVKYSKYNTMNLQLTRGCPFNCDFCDITALFGNKVRIKTAAQIISELELIYQSGWRKNVFFVDDNFIGNKHLLKNELLPAIIQWMQRKKYPFAFSTEASINLADDQELLHLMTKAGFVTVFIGIETTDQESLNECGKTQNTERNLVHSVHAIQKFGIEVTGGFILGFDNDSPGIFQKQIDFIRESGIISAMVGLLNAPSKTRLYKRLLNEGRIINETSGNNTDFSLNFIPKMEKNTLLKGYKNVISGVYNGKEYYNRVLVFIKRFTPNKHGKAKLSINHYIACIHSFIRLGIFDKYRKNYWNLIFWTLINKPQLVPLAITYSIYGFHFRKVFRDVL